MEKRPIGISFVSVLVFVVALISLVVGISLFVVGTPLDLLWTVKSSLSLSIRGTLVGNIFGIFLLLLGTVLMASGYGLLKGNKIAWWAVIVIFMVNAVGDLASVIMGNIDSISGVIIVGILVLYLTRPHVRSYFKI
ncbi:hypothetical protein Metbo_1435 [Methanobacterium lacus]|uniref:DUF4383 domain-containing protein n=1 Tax=Methanobacterium lacus (strain AL-21) TaxID=877455 RepID=F0T847_METLA|nr:hypothetical protein [Methanobacterium lacus]ADZ09673.1 hypothetical protein Metbo_1435 [Methanobacterium lacus]